MWPWSADPDRTVAPGAAVPAASATRILIHDFAGHPFQIDLSRRLARRGYQVHHVSCSSYPTGKGRLDAEDGLSVTDLAMGRRFARYNALRRFAQELSYGVRFSRLVASTRPDLVISCNDPLMAKAVSGLWCWVRRVPWVFWLQDLYSLAMTRELERRRVPLGHGVARVLQWAERRLLRSADGVVAITDDFLPLLERWGVSDADIAVVENWAPIDELPRRPRLNDWRSGHAPDGRFLFVYAGTLGLKHDPAVLYHLAAGLDPETAGVVVVSEGLGIDRLLELQGERPLENLRLVPFQPFGVLPDVLGAADVLLVLLEPDAGMFSVPSKVLTCLCAGRPLLAMMPLENLGARTIGRARAGRVVAPGDTGRFVREAAALMADRELCEAMGERGRHYAEVAFDGESIATRFEDVIARALARASGRAGSAAAVGVGAVKGRS